MGVYQSATPPDVRAKSLQRMYSRDEWDRFGKDQLTYYERRRNKIPRKVKPEVTESEHNVTVRFDWYEVETFN